MKTIITCLTLIGSLNSFANESAYLHCSDGKVEIILSVDSDVAEIGSTSVRELFEKNNKLTIKSDGKTYVINQNVIVATDGMGNDAVQVLAFTSFGPLEPVTQFTFEHEGSYLSGYYSLPKEENAFFVHDFEKPVYFQNEEMSCATF